MTSSPPRIAIPVPTSTDHEYNELAWKQYAEAVERAGGVAVRVPLDEPQEALAQDCRLLRGSPASGKRS